MLELLKVPELLVVPELDILLVEVLEAVQFVNEVLFLANLVLHLSKVLLHGFRIGVDSLGTEAKD